MDTTPTPWTEVRLQVPFHDLDPLRVVWHGNYLKYFDVAREAWFQERGIDLWSYWENQGYVFPVIKTDIKYVHPLEHGDRFICRATLVEARVKIGFDFAIRRLEDDLICARGHSDQAAVRAATREMQLAVPEDIRIVLEGGRVD